MHGTRNKSEKNEVISNQAYNGPGSLIEDYGLYTGSHPFLVASLFVTVTEIKDPTLKNGLCRDANLWRSKIWRLSFFHYPPWNFNGFPPRQIDPAPNGNDLGHYISLT